jgi:hypothetical protein
MLQSFAAQSTVELVKVIADLFDKHVPERLIFDVPIDIG